MGITDQNDLPYKPEPPPALHPPSHLPHHLHQPYRHQQEAHSDSSTENNNACQKGWPSNGFGAKQIGWMDGIFGCMRPVLSLIGKGTVIDIKKPHDDWEIPFEEISDLDFLGSGAQGSVYSGKLRNETVAVKKVRHVMETDIRNLRNLDHENIIKFK